MTSRQRTARLAGVLYLLMGLAAFFSIMYIPRAFVVRGDAAATANNIASSPVLYGLGIVMDLAGQVAAVYLAATLYRLFRDVDRNQAMVLAAFLVAQAGMYFAIMLVQIAPLVLLSGAGYLSVIEKTQLDSLVLATVALRGRGMLAIGTYMGMWLVPFGILVIKCGFIPRLIGFLMLAAAAAYVAIPVLHFLVPDVQRAIGDLLLLPAAVAETAIVLWLLIKGARPEPAPA